MTGPGERNRPITITITIRITITSRNTPRRSDMRLPWADAARLTPAMKPRSLQSRERCPSRERTVAGRNSGPVGLEDPSATASARSINSFRIPAGAGIRLSDISIVPEPATLTLVFGGLGACIWSRHRHRTSS
jgi:hypothetical protein